MNTEAQAPDEPLGLWTFEALQIASFTYRRAWWLLTQAEIQAAWERYVDTRPYLPGDRAR